MELNSVPECIFIAVEVFDDVAREKNLSITGEDIKHHFVTH